MLIRAATAADVSAILALERSLPLAAHWMAAEYERIFTPGQTPRVALTVEDGGALRGFVVGRALGPDWEIENVAVAAAAQRSGFATALLNRFLQTAREGGASRVYLEVRESNQAARALYEKAGFAIAGRRREYYRDPAEDAIVYHRLLSR